MKKISIIISLILVIFITSCSNYYYDQEKLNIVTTTTMLEDLANQIGKDKVSVTALMGVGVDPHLYTPKAKDTEALLKSDFVIYNGLHLEGKMVDVLDKLGSSKPVLNIGNDVLLKGTVLSDKTGYDPHIWFDVNNWIIAANSLKDKLIELDSINKDFYELNANNYINKLND